MPQTVTKRVNVTFPVALLEELRQYVPRQERNRFIVEIMERELHQLRLRHALQESASALLWLCLTPC
jgi:metal-responsive CopG/Arc/MetJ family transcriptional regulator